MNVKNVMNISSVGLTMKEAKDLLMCVPYLVEVNQEGIPISFYPKHDGDEFLELKMCF